MEKVVYIDPETGREIGMFEALVVLIISFLFWSS
jgi:hypothetical protein